MSGIDEAVSRHPLRVLVVDDEPIARHVLREQLELVKDVEIAGEASNGFEAIAKIRELGPDVVLLDVQMPGLNGFQTLERLDGALPKAVIFVTAFDQYALRAFDGGAADYLLKPVREERLRQALERARQRVAAPEQTAMALDRVLESTAKGGGAQPARIVARKGRDYHLLDVSQVLSFRAEGELVWAFTAHERYLATHTLRALEDRLAGTGFRRIHRNALVNTGHIRKLSSASSQRWTITLSNNQELIVSKRQAHSIRDVLLW